MLSHCWRQWHSIETILRPVFAWWSMCVGRGGTCRVFQKAVNAHFSSDQLLYFHLCRVWVSPRIHTPALCVCVSSHLIHPLVRGSKGRRLPLSPAPRSLYLLLWQQGRLEPGWHPTSRFSAFFSGGVSSACCQSLTNIVPMLVAILNSAGIDFRRQNLSFRDVRSRLKSNHALKSKIFINVRRPIT